ncbi:MAG: HAD-IA family hydrolase [Rhodobacteraceae bacterium]|nr:HAD-IA family hydrolase [Paracoccaceae bacterium]
MGRDSLPQHKPDPAPLHAAFAALGAATGIFVGDSEIDAETPAAPGCRFCCSPKAIARALPRRWRPTRALRISPNCPIWWRACWPRQADAARADLRCRRTLAETEELHRRAFNETFAAAGLAWHWSVEVYRELLRVAGGKERMARHRADSGADAPDDASIAALHRAKTARYAALLASGAVTLRPGVATVIRAARAAGLRLAVATTTSPHNVGAVPGVLGAGGRRHLRRCCRGRRGRRKKPAPDIYRLALDRLDLGPAEAIAIEDSRIGMRAARAAGLAVLVTPSAYTAGEDFSGRTGSGPT